MIDIKQESLIAFNKLPSWLEDLVGKRMSPATLFRWRLRGVRGVRLESILVGGRRFTSAEAIQRFFDATTRAADDSAELASTTNSAGRSEEDPYAKLREDGIA